MRRFFAKGLFAVLPIVLTAAVLYLVVGFLYNFGQALLPELAYVVLFLPMLVVLVVRPEGLFGRATT